MRILHISDIHRAPSAPTGNDQLFGALLDDIKSYPKDNARLSPEDPQLGEPDFIIISGDLTQTGSEPEFQQAQAFLEQMLAWVGGERGRIIIVPGNHDINWAQSALSYKKASRDDFVMQDASEGDGTRALIKRASDDTYWRRDLTTYNNRLRPFKNFFDTFYQGRYTYSLDSNDMFTVYDMSADFGTVIVGYNSCDEVDAYRNPKTRKLRSLDRRGVFNRTAIYRAANSPSFHRGNESLLRIAVFHHNTRSVNYREDFLDPTYLDVLKTEDFDLCLHGHVHYPARDLFNPMQSSVLPVVGAGSLAAPYKDRPEAAPMGYNLIVADTVSGGIWVHTRRRDELRPAWQADYQWEGKPYYVARKPTGKGNHVPPSGLADNFCQTMLQELEHYYLEDHQVRRLCFNLGVKYGSLGGATNPARLQSLLESFREPEGLQRLLIQCQHDHPQGSWPALPTRRRACP